MQSNEPKRRRVGTGFTFVLFLIRGNTMIENPLDARLKILESENLRLMELLEQAVTAAYQLQKENEELLAKIRSLQKGKGKQWMTRAKDSGTSNTAA